MLRRQPSFPQLSHDERLLDLTTERGEEEVVGSERCLCVQGSVGSVFRFAERLSDLFRVQPHSKNMASLRLRSKR